MGYQFYVPTRTLFGAGKLNELHAQTMYGKKAMSVISNGKSITEKVLSVICVTTTAGTGSEADQ